MMAYYTCEHVRGYAHIGMFITTSTYCESHEVLVSNIINQFTLGSKLVSIACGGGANLAICKAIFESDFDKTGVVELGKPMFVMGCLSHVLSNAYTKV